MAFWIVVELIGGMNMFEKEAEDSFKCKKVLYKWETDKHSYIDGFKDGVEFGYNNANEWHFVKDGDLPNTENLECLCIIRPDNEMLANKDFRGVLYFRSGRFYLDEDNCNDCLKETNSDFTDLVIAWKEIVYSKEIK